MCYFSSAESTRVTICTRWFWWGRFEIQAFCWHKHWQMHSVFLQGDSRQSHILCRWIYWSLRQLYDFDNTSVARAQSSMKINSKLGVWFLFFPSFFPPLSVKLKKKHTVNNLRKCCKLVFTQIIWKQFYTWRNIYYVEAALALIWIVMSAWLMQNYHWFHLLFWEGSF